MVCTSTSCVHLHALLLASALTQCDAHQDEKGRAVSGSVLHQHTLPAYLTCLHPHLHCMNMSAYSDEDSGG
jgi:hypothetical protein